MEGWRSRRFVPRTERVESDRQYGTSQRPILRLRCTKNAPNGLKESGRKRRSVDRDNGNHRSHKYENKALQRAPKTGEADDGVRVKKKSARAESKRARTAHIGNVAYAIDLPTSLVEQLSGRHFGTSI